MGKRNLDSELQIVTGDVKRLSNLMVGVIVVLAIAFGGLLTNYLAAKQASYENLKDSVIEQKSQIELMSNRIESLTKVIQDEQKAVQEIKK